MFGNTLVAPNTGITTTAYDVVTAFMGAVIWP
jgi:hypothetical protein